VTGSTQAIRPVSVTRARNRVTEVRALAPYLGVVGKCHKIWH